MKQLLMGPSLKGRVVARYQAKPTQPANDKIGDEIFLFNLNN